ncbi:hypothetical protein M5E89_03060 [Acidaminococcus intestini]|nr:hypothetical protein M5E89_03060 [Acidaminococcus intestini]
MRLLALLTRQEIVGRKVIARMERELDEIEEVTASQKAANRWASSFLS